MNGIGRLISKNISSDIGMMWYLNESYFKIWSFLKKMKNILKGRMMKSFIIKEYKEN